MRKMCIIVCLLLSVNSAFAKDRERVYDAQFEKVWAACVQVATEKYTVTHSDKASGTLTFHQRFSLTKNTWGMDVNVTVVPVNEKQTKVTLNIKKEVDTEISWASHVVTKKFYEGVEKALRP